MAILHSLSYLCFFMVVLILSLCMISSSQSDDPNTQFIQASCNATLHPTFCFKTLSPYADSIGRRPMKMANTVLSITLNRTKEVSNTVLNFSRNQDFSPREAGAVADCVDNMGDSVDKLQRSLFAMKDLNGSSSEFDFQMSSIQTWVSAALTDETTCMDGVDLNERIKNVIRGWIVNVAKLASISLALINTLLDK